MKEKGQTDGSKGFSLIEVTIGILILGILMVPAIAIYEKYRQDHIRAATTIYPNKVTLALQKYAILYARYPRPARPDLASTDPNFGREAPIPGGAGFPNCSPNSVVVCETNPPSARVLIGTVPFAEIGLPRQMAFDGYGRQFTYAVTSALTNPGAFPANEVLPGAGPTSGIRVTNIAGGNAPNTSAANVHFVVVSHGQDGLGSFTGAGGLKAAPCAGPASATENCNNDALFNFNNRPIGFAPGILRDETFPWISLGLDAANNPLPGYFDDYLSYTTSTATNIDWTRLAGSSDVISRNGAPVQIGRCALTTGCPAAPTATLEVWGNVRASTLQTDRLCVGWPTTTCSGGSSFFTPSLIMGTPALPGNATPLLSYPGGGIRCGQFDSTTNSGQAMTGIQNADELCATGSTGAGMTLPTFAGCPSEQGPIGTTAGGGIQCGS